MLGQEAQLACPISNAGLRLAAVQLMSNLLYPMSHGSLSKRLFSSAPPNTNADLSGPCKVDWFRIQS